MVGIKAFDDNIVTVCNMGYNVDHLVFGAFLMRKDVPVTVTVNKILRLLPAEQMRPRLADSRICLLYTSLSIPWAERFICTRTGMIRK